MEKVEDNNQVMLSDEKIMRKIFLIREKKVMLDRDLADLYEVKAIRLREQVKRNISRFPEHFMFRLTEKETDYLVSHFAIPSKKHLGGHKPYVFTEHGVLMLANVLKSDRAIKMSIRIIEVFVKVRETLLTQKDILLRLEKIERTLTGHDKKVHLIFEYLKQMEQSKQEELDYENRRRIGFKRISEE